MVTFNEMLRVHGIDCKDVALLRHTGTRGRRGVTPYELWERNESLFDLYQSTQAPGEQVFSSPLWATFLSTPENDTLFAGLYGAKLGDRSRIDWQCPMSGLAPGEEKGRPSDLYDLTPLQVMKEYRGRLKIGWGKGWIAWARYAHRNDHPVLSDVDMQPFARFDTSPEGETTWRMQLTRERDSRLSNAVLSRNAIENNGSYTCEACHFRHSDRALFDAHHAHPLNAGPRQTSAADLMVLCPTCHRRAHRSGNRMLPYSLRELQTWNQEGRP